MRRSTTKIETQKWTACCTLSVWLASPSSACGDGDGEDDVRTTLNPSWNLFEQWYVNLKTAPAEKRIFFLLVCENGRYNPNATFTYDTHPTVFHGCYPILGSSASLLLLLLSTSFVNFLSVCVFFSLSFASCFFFWRRGELTLSILCAIRIRTYACQFGVTYGPYCAWNFRSHICCVCCVCIFLFIYFLLQLASGILVRAKRLN